MITTFRSLTLLFCVGFIHLLPSIAWTMVDPYTESEDLSYDELLQEIESHKITLQKQNYMPPEVFHIHGGIGSTTTYSKIKAFGRIRHFEQSGMQFSLGADLNSTQWYALGSFRNYGTTILSGEELSLKQLDFKVGYKNPLVVPWVSRFGIGLSTRMVKYSDLFLQKSQEEVSPAFLFWGGVSAQLSPAVSIGGEASGRAPFVNSQLDQGSIELALNIEFSI